MRNDLTPERVTDLIIDAVNQGNVSQGAMARRIGLSESTMHRRMTRKREFTVSEGIRIMDALGLKLSEEMRRARHDAT